MKIMEHERRIDLSPSFVIKREPMDALIVKSLAASNKTVREIADDIGMSYHNVRKRVYAMKGSKVCVVHSKSLGGRAGRTVTYGLIK